MARPPAGNYNADDPIILPLLRNDPFNLALHDKIYHEMQYCVLKPVDNIANGNRQGIWNPALDSTHEHINAQNTSGSNSHVCNCSECETGENITHLPKLRKNSSVNSYGYDTIDAASKRFLPSYIDNASNISATQLLANHSRKLSNEDRCNAESYRDTHTNAIDQNSYGLNTNEWLSYPVVSDPKVYNMQNSSHQWQNSTNKS